ncbi:MAG: pyrimidine dimer DNA glycosylase/endonuclease V [Archaeoglobaceae archaeon]
MRLWSLHPRMLDAKGLVALWREALLARKVLEGKTKGYRNHPQLQRFRNYSNPIVAINSYLYFVFVEATKRGYRFSREKVYELPVLERIIPVTKGQVEFEREHLAQKLSFRNHGWLKKLPEKVEVNPVFYVVEGEVEPWEKLR